MLDRISVLRSLTHPYPSTASRSPPPACRRPTSRWRRNPRDPRHWPFVGSVVDYLAERTATRRRRRCRGTSGCRSRSARSAARPGPARSAGSSARPTTPSGPSSAPRAPATVDARRRHPERRRRGWSPTRTSASVPTDRFELGRSPTARHPRPARTAARRCSTSSTRASRSLDDRRATFDRHRALALVGPHLRQAPRRPRRAARAGASSATGTA